jgi:tripartite-type tricarboxylate transporter receptor subunit TctC
MLRQCYDHMTVFAGRRVMNRFAASRIGLAPAVVAAAFAIALPSIAPAGDFPDHPIKLIVPFGPGGPPDVSARLIGSWLSDHLGPVVVENHVGAGGGLAARAVASSPPDGYTLLAATAGSLAISPQLYKNPGFDPVKDFAAVAQVSSAPLVVAINPRIPVSSVKELVAYTKANPGKLNYGAVIGTPPHMVGEMFKHITGADIVFVPYKSASQAAIDVLAGQMNMTFEGTTAIVPHVKSGEIRALAVTSPKRIPEIPDVPTMDELGYLGMPPDSWQAIVAPAGTPPDVIARLNKAVNDGLANPQLRDKIIELGGTPEPKSVKEFADYIPAQYKRWAEVIRITGVKLDQ